MKDKKLYVLILSFIICILSISAISATENTVNKDVISADNNQENLETNIQYDEVSTSKENSEIKIEEKNNNDKKSESETDKTTTDNEGELTFNDLNTTINDNTNSTVYLSNNYKYNKDSDTNFQNGIIINRNLTIYGNGVTLDGSNLARIFNVSSDFNVNFYNINFINGNSENGGAIYQGNAYNCTFKGNNATYGGAICRGNAYNCTFTENNATNGGSVSIGDIYDCTFIGNNANNGGALHQANAYNCTFKNNNATSGQAMYEGNSILCRFNGETTEGTNIIPSTINVSNYSSTYKSGKKLEFNLTANGILYNGYNTTIEIYQNDTLLKRVYGLTGEGWTVDLDYGTYTAVLKLTEYPDEPSSNATITIKDTLTFTDLNTTINDNTNSTIYLSNNYTYDTSFDNNFKNGILISRNLTIYGNGITLNGNNIARIFNVSSDFNVNFYNINFINGNSENGGAIYGGNAYNCTFTNNTAVLHGGALFEGNAYNCNFRANYAMWYGGAINNGTAYNCTFTENNAVNGGAINNGTAYNCTFTENNAYDGGAIYKGNAYNCNFTENEADKYGGAIYMGAAYYCNFNKNKAKEEGGALIKSDATNCTFTENNAVNGGAINNGTAYNCTFTENNAVNGGAINNGTAYNCTFKGNNATNGGAMYEGTAILCIFNGDTHYNTTIIPAIINVLNYTSTYKSGEKLQFNLTADNKQFDGVNTTIKIYKGNVLYTTVYGLTGEGWIVNLKPGSYTAELSLTDYPDEQPSNTTINVIKEKTTITANPVSTIYNVGKNLIITLKDQNGKAIKGALVTVNLGGAKKYTTDAKGQIKINIAKLTPKTYNAKIRYDGSDIFNTSTGSVKVTVKKATPKIIAKQASYKLKLRTKKYTAIFKDNKNKTLKNTKVSLKVNGKNYITKTNSKGQAVFKITNLKKKGRYIAVITIPTSKYYNKLSKKVKITVKQ